MGHPRTGIDRLPVKPLRDAYLASGLTPSEVCRQLGWVQPNHRRGHDTTKLQRALGAQPSIKDGKQYRQSTIRREWAGQIAAAIGVELADLYPDDPAAQARTRCKCGEPMLVATDEGLCGFCIAERELAVA